MTKNLFDSTRANFLLQFGMLRGGRVTKVAGRDASYAPQMGVSAEGHGGVAGIFEKAGRTIAKAALLPLLLLSGATAAYAQDNCINPTESNVICSDDGPSASTEQAFDLTGDAFAADVQIQSGFQINSIGTLQGGLLITDDLGITVTQVGTDAIQAFETAVFLNNTGTGDVDVTLLGDILSTNQAGLVVGNDGGNIDVSASGVIVGETVGVYAVNTSGSTNLDLNVVGANGYGLGVFHTGTDLNISANFLTAVSTNLIGSGGTGTTTIDLGNVYSTTGYGLQVQVGASGTGTDIDIVSISSDAGGGLLVLDQGAGDLSIDIGTTEAGGGDGIEVSNYNGSVTINSGDIIASDDGISLNQFATDGLASINLVGTVVAGSDGIIAGSDSDMEINVTGVISASGEGINSSASGDSEQTINIIAASVVQSIGDDGIAASTDDGSLTVNLGDGSTAAGALNGISLYSDAGDITLSGFGSVIGGNDDGVEVVSLTGDVLIENLVNAIGEYSGIDVQTAGNVTIQNVGAGGQISGNDVYGIEVDAGGDVAISTAGGVDGDNGGIAVATSSGGVTMDTTGGTVSAGGFGIQVAADGDVSITTADVYGNSSNGIEVDTDGSIAIDTTSGYVFGLDNAIRAESDGQGSAVDITTGDVYAQVGDAIRVYNFSAGDGVGGNVRVDTSAGFVEAAVGAGIYVTNLDVTADVDVVAGDILADAGIVVENFAGTATNIEVQGEVVGDTYDGVYVYSRNDGVVSIDMTGAGFIYGDDNGVEIDTDGDIVMDLGNRTIQAGNNGILAEVTSGDVTIAGDGAAVTGLGQGVVVLVDNGDVSVSGLDLAFADTGVGILADVTTGDITVTDIAEIISDEAGIRAVTEGGDISIQNIGSVGVYAATEQALRAYTGSGDINIGGVEAVGNLVNGAGDGIVAESANGSVTINSTAGPVEGDANGILAAANFGDVNITTADVSGNLEDGIIAVADIGGVTIDTTAGEVSAGGDGILAAASGEGDGILITTGDVSAITGNGVIASVNGLGRPTGDLVIDTSAGAVTAAGIGVGATSTDSTSNTSITTGDVYAFGVYGVLSNNSSGTTTQITTNGDVEGASVGGIVAAQPYGGELTIEVNGLVDADVVGIYTISDDAVDITISESGLVSSDQDQAVFAEGTGDVTVVNYGTVNGMVGFDEGDDTFENWSGNSLNLRNFVDTDLDNIRDQERVAFNDFGAGDDTFVNAADGVVNLLTVHDQDSFTPDTDDDIAPTSWDTTGSYNVSVPENAGGHINESIGTTGVEQAHLTNLETFVNAGSIVMQDMMTGGTTSVWGDVMVITGAAAAGIDGDGVFVSDGGSLYLDTVLDAGTLDRSDVLVVDGTQTADGSATSIFIENAVPGQGAGTDANDDGVWTEGEGILVVSVLDGAASDSGAFDLGAAVIDNGYFYNLFYGENGGDWYLANNLGTNDLGACDANLVVAAGNYENILGCYTNDQVELTGVATAENIEGAGGMDVISVTGDASVNTILGGGDGQDYSADQDAGDIIGIDTSGTVDFVDGNLGDDSLFVQNGTVGTLAGSEGNDLLVAYGGTINLVSGGADEDVVLIDGGAVATVDGGAGDDRLYMQSGDVSVTMSGGAGADTFYLYGGTITNVAGDAGEDTILLDGAIVGDIYGGDDADRVYLTSGIVQNVSGDAGDDRIYQSGGAVGVAILGGEGNDLINLNGGPVGAVYGDAGNDDINLIASSITTAIDGGDGDDDIDLTGGDVVDVMGGAGNDAITLDGTVMTGDITGDDGDDVIELLSGSVDDVFGGAGDDMLTLDGASVADAIDGGDGADTIDLLSGDANRVEAGDGADTITLDGATIVTGIWADLGDDTIDLLSGSANFANGEEGDDTITLDGATIANGVTGGDGEDMIDLLSGSATFVQGNDGADAITLDGATIATNINGGLGDDVIDLLSGSVGFILGDEGADTITLDGATVAGSIQGEEGDDVVNLLSGSSGSILAGSGDDVVLLDGADVGSINTSDGDDTITLVSGTTSSVNGGDGSDLVVVESTFDATSIPLNGGDDISTADGFIDTLQLNGFTAALEDVNQANFEIVLLDGGSDATFDGAVTVGSDADTGLIVASGSMITTTSGFDLTGNLWINSGGTVMAGAGMQTLNVSGDMVVGGMLDLVDGMTDDVVNVGGNLVGADGTIAWDVDFADRSADFVSVAGEVSGVTNVSINGLNSNSSDGSTVTLLTAAGAIGTSNFALDGGIVLAGIYGYELDVEGQSLVLSGFLLPTNAVYEQLAFSMMPFSDVGTLHDRVGSGLLVDAEGNLEHRVGIWGTAEAKWSDANPGASMFGSEIDSDQTRFTLGATYQPFDKLAATVMGRWASVDAAIGSDLGIGNIDAEGYGVGLALTYLGDDGLYADATVHRDWIDFDYEVSDLSLLSSGHDATTTSASFELGYRLPLSANLSVTPQMQWSWQEIVIDSFAGPLGEVFDDDNKNDWKTLRLGARLDAGLGSEGLTAFALVNARHIFDPLLQSRINGVTLSSYMPETTGEIGAGVEYRTGNITAFAKGSYETDLGGDTEYNAVAARVGVRVGF